MNQYIKVPDETLARMMLAKGVSVGELARKYNTSSTVISNRILRWHRANDPPISRKDYPDKMLVWDVKEMTPRARRTIIQKFKYALIGHLDLNWRDYDDAARKAVTLGHLRRSGIPEREWMQVPNCGKFSVYQITRWQNSK